MGVSCRSAASSRSGRGSWDSATAMSVPLRRRSASAASATTTTRLRPHPSRGGASAAVWPARGCRSAASSRGPGATGLGTSPPRPRERSRSPRRIRPPRRRPPRRPARALGPPLHAAADRLGLGAPDLAPLFQRQHRQQEPYLTGNGFGQRRAMHIARQHT